MVGRGQAAALQTSSCTHSTSEPAGSEVMQCELSCPHLCTQNGSGTKMLRTSMPQQKSLHAHMM